MKFRNLIFIILILTSYFYGLAKDCESLLTTTIKTKYEHIFAGQESIGKRYALYKALQEAGLPLDLEFKDLNNKQKRALKKLMLKELKDPIPAVRDPFGRFFLLDRHHTIFVMAKLFKDFKKIPIRVELVYDAKTTDVSWKDFFDLAIKENWFYTPTAKSILSKPLHILDLADNVERSALGLFFISTEIKYEVPMKGKFFQPFIQFYLADFIRENQIMTFPSEMDSKDIPEMRRQLLEHPLLVEFLAQRLKPNAPLELRDFLLNLSSKK